MRTAVALLTLASFGSILAVAAPQAASGSNQSQTETKSKTKKHTRKASKKQKKAADASTGK
jgi:hypothetical protein